MNISPKITPQTPTQIKSPSAGKNNPATGSLFQGKVSVNAHTTKRASVTPEKPKDYKFGQEK